MTDKDELITFVQEALVIHGIGIDKTLASEIVNQVAREVLRDALRSLAPVEMDHSEGMAVARRQDISGWDLEEYINTTYPQEGSEL